MPPRKQTDIFPPLGLPKRGRKEPKHTAMELLRATWPNRKDKAKTELAVKKVRTGTIKKSTIFEPETPFYRLTVYNKVKRHDHMVTVFIPTAERFTSKTKPIIDCTCGDHVFTFEYALAKKYGNALIWRCNGQPPVERNPGKVLGMCSHAYLALRYMQGKAKEKALIQKSRTPVKLNLRRG